MIKDSVSSDSLLEFEKYQWHSERGDAILDQQVVAIPRKQKRKWQFLKGPIPLWWLEQASQLEGKAVLVCALLWYRWGLSKKKYPVTISGDLMQRFNISRQAVSRCLKQMEASGLIKITRHDGKAHKIEIIEDEDQVAAMQNILSQKPCNN